MRKITLPGLLALALLAVPAAAGAQEAPAAPAAADEAAQLRERIARLQAQALADPALEPAQDTFNTVLQGAMVRLDPAAAAKWARAAAMDEEVAAARAAEDNAKLHQLAEEAASLKAYFDALRPRALAEADVQAARQVYLARVLERMKEIDPQTQRYVDRLAELRGAASGGGGR